MSGLRVEMAHVVMYIYVFYVAFYNFLKGRVSAARSVSPKKHKQTKYNLREVEEVSPEELEAYRLNKVYSDDPMANF